MGRAGASSWAICGGEIYAILFQTECKIEERGLFQEEGARPPSEGHKSLGRAGGAPQTTFGASSEPLQGAFFEIFILGQGGASGSNYGTQDSGGGPRSFLVDIFLGYCPFVVA